MDIIERLCKQFTDLTDEEIGIIKGMSAVLQPLANLEVRISSSIARRGRGRHRRGGGRPASVPSS